MDINLLFENFAHAITFWVVFPVLISLGIFLSIKLKFPQLTKISYGLRSILKDDGKGEGNITHFEAIATVLAGNLGTGNISGMAVALGTGGPGALIWMWVMAFFGAILQYSGCLLGGFYRKQNDQGEFLGGPMYYIEKGMKKKGLAILFSVFSLLTAFSCGNFVQVNSLSLPLQEIGWNPFLISLIVASAVGYVIIGGGHRVALIASKVVPFMATLYLLVAFLILGYHLDKVLPAFSLLFRSAFDFSSMFGGGLGFGIAKALSTGFERGIFATDAGTGIAPILQANAKAKSPVMEGIVAMVAPFIVLVICTITGLVLIVTGAFEVPGLKSTLMCTYAFEKGVGHEMGAYVVVISLILFAYTTILAWAFCGEKAIEYLFDRKKIPFFRWLYVGLIPIGVFAKVDLVWHLADITMAGMLLTNLSALAYLFPLIIRESEKYFGSKEFLEIDTLDEAEQESA